MKKSLGLGTLVLAGAGGYLIYYYTRASAQTPPTEPMYEIEPEGSLAVRIFVDGQDTSYLEQLALCKGEHTVELEIVNCTNLPLTFTSCVWGSSSLASNVTIEPGTEQRFFYTFDFNLYQGGTEIILTQDNGMVIRFPNVFLKIVEC